jgi:POT family proton-dependent oligopeptide transporter
MNDATTVRAPGKQQQFFGQPSGMATLFFTEMWERFSYYGMRALLILFLTGLVSKGGFGLDDKTAAAIYGLYTAGVYVACLPGGWIADRLIGTQAATLWGGVIIALGHIMLGLAGASTQVFYLGLVVIVVGTGLLKPNISALVAQLYPEGGYRRDAGFTIYYMSVNLGAFLGPIATAWLAQQYGWHFGFFAAAVGMILGVGYFLYSRARLGEAGRTPAPPTAGKRPLNAHLWLASLAAVVVMGVLACVSGAIKVAPLALQKSTTWLLVAIIAAYFLYLFLFAGLTALERKRALMMLILFLAAALFWSGFEQAGSSFSLFAERFTVRQFGSLEVPAGWFQSLNPVFIIALAPFFSALWVRLGQRNLDPSAPLKFVFGLLGMAFGFAILAAAAKLVAADNAASGTPVSSGWLVSVYFIHTAGELCLAPVGLSAFTKLAPARLVGQSLGVWFMGLAFGNLLASQIAGEFDANNLSAVPGQMMGIFWFGVISAAALLLVGTLVQRWIAASGKE